MKLRAVLTLLMLALALASESPYLGKISLMPYGKYVTSTQVYFQPLNQEPKIANFKGKVVEIVPLTEEASCQPLSVQDPDDSPKIAIIDLTTIARPMCGISNKINNLRSASYQGFLLVLDAPGFLKNHCKMYDDSTFFTGVMDSSNYTMLKGYQDSGAGDESFKVQGVLSINLKNSDLKLLEIWVSSLNKLSYEALEYFNQAERDMPLLDKKITWVPRFASFDCSHGQSSAMCKGSEFIASCACKGQFCSPETRERTPAPIIQQDIRQMLIFNQYGTRYLHYAKQFAANCLEKYQIQKYISQCSTRIMDKLGINSYSINQIANQFLEECSEDENSKESKIYTTLLADQKVFRSYGRYPLVLINKQIIDYKNQQEFNALVCRKLQLYDDYDCGVVVDINNTTSNTTSVVFYILLGLTLLAAAGAVIYFYRKKLRRDVNKEIKMQVSTAVEHYFALTEASSTK